MPDLKNYEYFASRTVFELLIEPEVRARHPRLFFGVEGFSGFIDFLRGYDCAILEASPEKSLFDGFHEWLQMHHGANPEVCWSLYIRDQQGEGPAAIDLFYRLWDTFRAYRDAIGIRGLLEEYREYDIERYGRPTHYRKRCYLE